MTALFTLPTHANEPLLYGGERVPEFYEYPGICDASQMAPANLKPGTDAWMFRTAIRTGTEDTCPNFNGAFSIVTWGCGTQCLQGVIVDRTDGTIYWLPEVASDGYDFRADSSLLIVNPLASGDYAKGEVPEWQWRVFYEFKNGKFVLVYKDKGEANINIYDTPHPVDPESLEEIAP